MACDSQASNNGAIGVLADSKIIRHGPVLVACEGSFAITQLVRYETIPECSRTLDDMDLADWAANAFVPAIRKHLKERDLLRRVNDSLEFPGMTLIARGPEWLLIDSAGSIVRFLNEWWAIGSGAAEARGAMFAASVAEGATADEIADLGVAAAIALDDGCCAPIRHEWTE
ncbi:MAG TPA: hypothetical protein VK505_04925 [Steroidobacteraceae bacterium]|nr:hypothetical protein [Steroidobacteraceae bacterium]